MNTDYNDYFNGLLSDLMAEWGPTLNNPHTSAVFIEECASELLFHNISAVKCGAHKAAHNIRQAWVVLRCAAVQRET